MTDLSASVEDRLAALWREILGVEDVKPTDDFFAVGGYSLLAARLVGKIEAEFGQSISLRALFEARTIRELAEIIEQREEVAGQ